MNKNILITNLGKARKVDNDRYKLLNYKFENNEIIKSNIFGFALLKWLEKHNKNLEKVIILGTTTSMWDALLEDEEMELNESDYKLYEKIGNEVDSGVSNESILKLSNYLTHFYKIKIIIKIIPLGKDYNEQQEILLAMSQEISNNSNIFFDFTHGLRHLPFFALLSIFHLKTFSMSNVEKIYYGAMELTKNNVTPVVSLSYALEVMDWINAITISENRGNFKALSELNGINEILKVNLNKLSFLISTNQVGEMKKYAENIKNELLNNIDSLPIAGNLYKKQIIDKMLWTEKSSFALRQLEIASQALKNQSYLQSVTLLFEAFVSSRIKSDPLDYDNRENAKRKLFKTGNKTFKILNKLRNSLAHGSRPKGKQHYKDKNKESSNQKVLAILSDEIKLTSEIEKYINNIQQSINDTKGN